MKYAKAWAAFIAVVATVFVSSFTDNVIDVNETAEIVSTIVVGLSGVYAVYRVPNKTEE